MIMKSKQQHFTERLRSVGFDVVHFFPLDVLSLDSLSDFGVHIEKPSTSCGILIGNTHSAWEAFLMWYQQQPNRKSLKHPFNRFSEMTITNICNQIYAQSHIFWVHETKLYTVPAQKIAHQSGLAYLSAGFLNIHPKFGPWFALRSLVILSNEVIPPRTILQNPSSKKTEKRVCGMFEDLCQNTFGSSSVTSNHWRSWLTLRDSYDVGKKYRYTESQIEYHYTHDRNVLEREIEKTMLTHASIHENPSKTKD